MHCVCINKMNPNKPIRVSKEVKDALKKIKNEKELKSVDAVIKKLLKEKRMPKGLTAWEQENWKEMN